MSSEAEIEAMFKQMDEALNLQGGEQIRVQQEVAEKYYKFKLKASQQTIENTCNKPRGPLEPMVYQKFLETFYRNINERKDPRGLLVYHGTGAGKSYSSILMAYAALNRRLVDKVIVLLPAALKGNFQRHISRRMVDKFEFVSYNSNITSAKDELAPVMKNLPSKLNDKTLVIIDECQGVTSMISNGTATGIFLYNTLYRANCRIIALSATPIINSGYEFAILFNLLKPGTFKLDPAHFFNDYYLNNELINKKGFYNKIKGLVSYYQGANEASEVFPKSTLHLEYLPMSEFQTNAYIEADSHEKKISKKKKMVTEAQIISGEANSVKSFGTFRVHTRKACNFVRLKPIPTPEIPVGSTEYQEQMDEYENEVFEDLPKYSCKFAAIIGHIQDSTGPVAIYSNFVENTLLPLENILNNHYAITTTKWIGGETDREENLKDFNSTKNSHGEIIKVMLLSSAGAEGITLKNVRQMHIMEPHWNEIRIKQIIGRAVRVCSHSTLPIEEQHVDIYRYFATLPGGENRDLTSDEIIFKIAQRKYEFDKSIDKLVKISALDCELNKAQNLDVDTCIERYQ